jgi:hypothetical protein
MDGTRDEVLGHVERGFKPLLYVSLIEAELWMLTGEVCTEDWPLLGNKKCKLTDKNVRSQLSNKFLSAVANKTAIEGYPAVQTSGLIASLSSALY